MYKPWGPGLRGLALLARSPAGPWSSVRLPLTYVTDDISIRQAICCGIRSKTEGQSFHWPIWCVILCLYVCVRICVLDGGWAILPWPNWTGTKQPGVRGHTEAISIHKDWSRDATCGANAWRHATFLLKSLNCHLIMISWRGQQASCQSFKVSEPTVNSRNSPNCQNHEIW